jgi:hypothetical protein
MSPKPQTVDIPLTLHVTKRTQQKLIERAAASGTDLSANVSAEIEQTAGDRIPLEQISGDVHRRFLESGTTEDELSAELERAKHEARAERRNRRAS